MGSRRSHARAGPHGCARRAQTAPVPRGALPVFAAALLALLAGCDAATWTSPEVEVPPEYVGEWRGERMTLAIDAAGGLRYERVKEQGQVSVTAPIVAFDERGFEVGVGPVRSRFEVSAGPALRDGRWTMTVDGVELQRVDEGAPAPAVPPSKNRLQVRGPLPGATALRDARGMDAVDRDRAEHYAWGDACDGWHLLRREDLSVIAERVPPGACESRHRHARARQFFYVLEGAAVIEIEGRRIALAAGQGLEVPPGAAHQFRNESAADVHFLVVSHPPSHGDRAPA